MNGLTRSLVLIALTLPLSATAALAQSAGAENVSMSTLLSRGYEIKAAAPNGNKYVVFLQKDSDAYACEFVTTTNTRCGKIK